MATPGCDRPSCGLVRVVGHVAQVTTSLYAAPMANGETSPDLGALYGATRQRITAGAPGKAWTAAQVNRGRDRATPYLDTFFRFGPTEKVLGEHS